MTLDLTTIMSKQEEIKYMVVIRYKEEPSSIYHNGIQLLITTKLRIRNSKK